VIDLPDNIEELNLSMCEWLTSDLLEKIFIQTPHIKILKLNNELQLDYQSWVLLQQLENLERLELGGCHQLSDDDLLLIARGCIGLRSIDLSECKKLTEESFLEFSNGVRGLVDIDLSDTMLSDHSLIGFAHHCHMLEWINVTDCKNISDSAVLEVIKIALRLHTINLKGCRISKIVLNEIVRKKPNLQVIY